MTIENNEAEITEDWFPKLMKKISFAVGIFILLFIVVVMLNDYSSLKTMAKLGKKKSSIQLG